MDQKRKKKRKKKKKVTIVGLKPKDFSQSVVTLLVPKFRISEVQISMGPLYREQVNLDTLLIASRLDYL